MRRTGLLSRNALGYGALAAASVVVGRAVLGLHWRAVAVAAISLAAMALRESWHSARRLAERRRRSDFWLESSPTGAVAAEHAWRANELVAPRERRSLARGLRGVVRAARSRYPDRHALIVRYRVLPHVFWLEAMAARLENLAEPVPAAGMLAVRRLLCDGSSPLYVYEDDLGAALRTILARLDAHADPAETRRRFDERRAA
jgi:hypothetical protein